MKCNDLKERLDRKDAEVKSRTENTIKCFELVKDFVIDKLIEDHIECEFNGSGSYIYPRHVYDELFSKIGLEVSELKWDWRLSFREFDLSLIRYDRISSFLYINSDDEVSDRMKEEIKQSEDMLRFRENFDGKSFEKLIINHVLSFGFNYRYVENIWGKQVKTDSFVISRSDLEKKCCSE